MTCCPACKGSPPWFICRTRSCWCHIAADAIAANTPNKLTHTDKTADTAIGNVMNTKRRNTK